MAKEASFAGMTGIVREEEMTGQVSSRSLESVVHRDDDRLRQVAQPRNRARPCSGNDGRVICGDAHRAQFRAGAVTPRPPRAE